MKKVFAAISLLSIVSCGSGKRSDNISDTTVNAAAPGNSDGINTVGTDTAHMDTSLGKIKSDSAR